MADYIFHDPTGRRDRRARLGVGGNPTALSDLADNLSYSAEQPVLERIEKRPAEN